VSLEASREVVILNNTNQKKKKNTSKPQTSKQNQNKNKWKSERKGILGFPACVLPLPEAE